MTTLTPGIALENKTSSLTRIVAQVISFVFHPLLIPVYITCFLLFVHPLMFAGYESSGKLKLLGTVVVNLTMLPAITVFLCWRLKFVETVFLHTQRDRIIPLAAAMIFYFWCWFVLKGFTEIPEYFRQFLLGCFITIIVAWMSNIYFKISLHGLAMGGMFCFTFMVMYSTEGASAQYLAMAALISGLVCTSRMLLNAHPPF
ncbi:MAG: hypothetical protein ABI415_03040, partial [Flavitalea sp.]